VLLVVVSLVLHPVVVAAVGLVSCAWGCWFRLPPSATTPWLSVLVASVPRVRLVGMVAVHPSMCTARLVGSTAARLGLEGLAVAPVVALVA